MEEIKEHIVCPTDSLPVDERLGHFIINHSFHPYTRGHLVVQPMKCSNSSDQVHNFRKDTIITLFKLVRKVSEKLDETFKPERVYVWSFNEQQHNKPNWHFHFMWLLENLHASVEVLPDYSTRINAPKNWKPQKLSKLYQIEKKAKRTC